MACRNSVSTSRRFSCARLWQSLLVLVLWLGLGPVAMAAQAGALITAQAHASYRMPGMVQSISAWSATTVAQVAAVESLTLTGATSLRASPGADVTASYLLTNTGNTTSRYSFQLTGTGCIGTDIALGSIRLALDINGNGVAEPHETLPTGSTATSLAAGQSASLLVVGSTPLVASGTACLSLTATTAAQPQSAAVRTSVLVGSGASVSLTKTVASTGAPVRGTSTLDFTLTATNLGTDPAAPTGTAGATATPVKVNGVARSYVLIRDMVPAGTQYVMGTLRSSIASGVALYRLAGDEPFSYRTTEDAAAVEVAIGLPSLATQTSTTMGFTVRLSASTPGQAPDVVNVGDVDYQTGAGQVTARSNTVVLPVSDSRLGVALQALSIVPQTNALGATDGTALVTFRARLRNYGDGPLNNPQLNHLLEGSDAASTFGTYTSASQPASGQYTVVPGSLSIVASSPSSAVLQPAVAFTGRAGAQNLLADGGLLPVGGDVTVEYRVRVNFVGRSGTVQTSAAARATSAGSQTGDVGDDASVNGTDPDPAGTGLPQTQASKTPVVPPPMLSITHTTATPRRVGAGLFEIDHTIVVTNQSAITAQGVRVFNNLECALKPNATGAVSQWQMLTPPVARNGKLTINAGYTGIAASGASACGNSVDQNTGAPMDESLSITDGNTSLATGESETITFTVKASLTSANGGRAEVSHRVWAVAYDASATQATQIIAATSGVLELVLLIDPQGIVYDSTTRLPVAGATVRVQRMSCQSGALGPITAAEISGGSSGAFSYHADGSVSMVTGATGEYQFFWLSPPVLNLCTYAISVTPPAAGGYVASTAIPVQPGTFASCSAVVPNPGAPQGAEATTHYASVVSGYDPGTSTICEVLHNHIPLDPVVAGQAVLFLEKGANKKELELGDFIDYKLTLSNRGSIAASGVSFQDTLPPGFAYVAGTTVFNGMRVADPSGGAGPSLVFDQPTHTLAAGASVSLQYRVKVGAGAPTAGPAVNRAVAQSGTVSSNVATWSVKVTGGVFADDAFAFGKVFLDCNRNGEQDGDTEPGVPGVRLFMENGTSVVTDGEGRWSLFGLKPITHAIKLDRRSLPAGAQLQPWDNRNAGSADSRFLDVKKGELAKANFPIVNCETPELIEAVRKRREDFKSGTELDAAARLRLTPSLSATVTSGPGPASQGGWGSAAPATTPLISLPASLGGTAAGAPAQPGRPHTAPGSLDPLPAASPVELEALLPSLDAQPGFLDLKDGDTLPSRNLNVRVKGPQGTTLRLSVGGVEVSERRVGKKAELGRTAATAWEYIGVTLQPGTNRLQLTVVDPMGNPRGEVMLNVTAPADLGQLLVNADAAPIYADPLSSFPVAVRLTDAAGVPVTARTPVTLQADRGSFADADLNPNEPGTQVLIEGGVGRFQYVPPAEPGAVRLRASTGAIDRETLVTVLPHLQPMSGIGIAEAVFSGKPSRGAPAGADSHGSAFEAELSGHVREGSNGRAAARTAFYFKGAVKGDYLLTAAYDSDKTTKDRLFRDIRPDEYYPIYGDDSTRGYDAQSIGKLYVRIDKERSYFLYGDFTSSASPEVRRLSQVNRSLNGVRHHYETDRARVSSYASQTSARQQVEELPANGLSFYFLTGSGDIVVNSEQVQLLVRSRSQPQVVLTTRNLVRNTDYTLEPLTRRLMLVTPLPSVDGELNPQSLRVTYEVDAGGPEYLTAGVDAQFKLGERVQVGVAVNKDDNPENQRRGLQAVTVLGRVGESTVVAAEAVRTESDAQGTGNGRRLEIRHAQGDFKASAEISRTDAAFENPGATTSAGRTEATARAELPLNDTTRLRAEASYSRNDNDPAATSTRNVAVAVHKKLNDHVAIEAGLRDGNIASTRAGSFDYGVMPGTTGIGAAAPVASATPETVNTTSARMRVTVRPPALPSSEVFGEIEQDLRDGDRRVIAVGGAHAIGPKARVYGRREFESSLYEGAGTGVDNQRVTSLVGIDGAYMEGGRVFNEYRVGAQGASNGMGVRNAFTLSESLQLTGSIEHAKQLSGTGDDATTATVGLDYNAGPWRGSSAIEWRDAGDTGGSWLFNLGGAYRLDNDWSLLARTVMTQTRDASSGTRQLSRSQIGLAWRPASTDVINGLLRYEHRQESIAAGSTGASAYSLYGTTGAALPGDYGTHLVAGVLNLNPARGSVLTTRYAARFQSVADDISRSKTVTQLLHARYTRDLTPDWDIGLQLGALHSRGGGMQTMYGLELGYQVANGLWLSGGYNWRGLRDAELAGANHTNRGWYLRLRFKFDETTFGLGGGATASTGPRPSAPTAPEPASASLPPAPATPVLTTASAPAAQPATAPGAAADGLNQPLAARLLWSEDLLFGAGAELLPAGRARIERLGALLKQAGASKIELSMGHGDSPARVDSVWLPRTRAVRALLRKACACAVGMSVDTQPVPTAGAATQADPATSGYALYVQAAPTGTPAAAPSAPTPRVAAAR